MTDKGTFLFGLLFSSSFFIMINFFSWLRYLQMWQLKIHTGNATRLWVFLCVLLLFKLQKSCFSIGDDTLSPGQSLSVTQTLISQGSIFELGFFKKGNFNVYLGIWCKNFADKIIVWVANREQPLKKPDTWKLTFSVDNNLIFLTSSEYRLWSTNLMLPAQNSTEAVLLDNGNLVIRDVSKPSIIYWQSFDHPTDTWLPGAKLGINKLTGASQALTSWKNSEDPAPGIFSVGIDPDERKQFVLEWNMSRKYWSSGVWNGQIFSSIPEWETLLFSNFSFVSIENETYLVYSTYRSPSPTLIIMDITGQLRVLTRISGVLNSNILWSQPVNQSDVYSFCGPFGVFSQNDSMFCECLQGFEPFAIKDTELNDWSGGCERKTPLQCENSTSANGKRDGFLEISNMKLPANAKAFPAKSAKWCELGCEQNCSCTAYAYNSSGCFVWEGALLNLQLSDGSTTKQDLYLKLAASELHNGRGKGKKVGLIISVLVPLTVTISGGIIYCLCMRRLKQMGEKDSSEDLLLFDFSASTNTTDGTNTGNNMRKGGKKDIELPLFSFASVSAATANFSEANKLGEGGFGPVYKGKSCKGHEMAVKRLSKRSGQGLQEFRNETVLIAKLQHRNLVKLLGCCIEREENILVYEYMPNKSLDFFLFDPSKKEILDWGTRIRIIEGIAQGLLYLHQYSRLRIIHRDLKAGNILLDNEMNPKISDFGMARIFGGNDSQANTNRIVGTYGYMAPEYAMEGRFSIKSDVFSFGVLLLEIVSGKKNTSFYNTDSLNLLGYAWDLWNADRGLDLMDPILGNPYSTSTLLRYINIGLLCVQENPTDRPTMSHVVSMIGNELVPLPKPKQRAFSTSRSVINTNSLLSNAGNGSVNTLTLSVIEAR